MLPDGATFLDSITFPSQSQDISYGRLDDDWFYMMPSPLASNTVLGIHNDSLSSSQFQLATVYPNPFNMDFQIELNIQNNIDEITLTIFSLIGKTVYSRTINNIENGKNVIVVELDNTIASGPYFLKMENSKNRIIRKILYIK